MTGKKVNTQKQDYTEKVIKIGTFAIAIVGAITGIIAWYNNQKENDNLKDTRIATYKNLSVLVGKMISNDNADSSLMSQSKVFNREFYNGEMLLVEDTIVCLAMNRFKLELEDKLNGNENILSPNKFENAGRDVILKCQAHIVEMTKKSKN
ncbi:MAG: hypothetical protein EOO46_22295 [Flavobacterium sp.]|nr:MAG: hypothetical protein EOO46_22295 [Flavobacterium sp.]